MKDIADTRNIRDINRNILDISTHIKKIITDEINDIIHNKFTIENTMRTPYNDHKYLYPENIKQNMIGFMKRFKDTESVEKLLYSMRDVYILGLV